MTSKYQAWMKRMGPVEDFDYRRVFDSASNLKILSKQRVIKWCHKSNTPQELETQWVQAYDPDGKER